jgi:hypothetical protein
MKTRQARRWVLVAAASLVSGSVLADTLELRSGTVIEGEFVSATPEYLVMGIGGQIQRFEISDISRINFDPRPATRAPPVATRREVPSRTAIVGAGTVLEVSNLNPGDSGGFRSGESFSGALVSDLKTGGVIVAPAGSEVFGEISNVHNRAQGDDKGALIMVLTELRIGRRLQSIRTDAQKVPGTALARSNKDAGQKPGNGVLSFRLTQPFATRLGGQ